MEQPGQVMLVSDLGQAMQQPQQGMVPIHLVEQQVIGFDHAKMQEVWERTFQLVAETPQGEMTKHSIMTQLAQEGHTQTLIEVLEPLRPFNSCTHLLRDH